MTIRNTKENSTNFYFTIHLPFVFLIFFFPPKQRRNKKPHHTFWLFIYHAILPFQCVYVSEIVQRRETLIPRKKNVTNKFEFGCIVRERESETPRTRQFGCMWAFIVKFVNVMISHFAPACIQTWSLIICPHFKLSHLPIYPSRSIWQTYSHNFHE